MADIRSRYDEIFAACAVSPAAFEHTPHARSFHEVTREERQATWDRLYAGSGFGIWLANFREIFTDEAANAEFSEYIANRIRERVQDPGIAEKLIPRDHGFGIQRLPMETNYFEVYNRNNVKLVQLNETPIERITPNGLRTTEREYEFDIIVYATGFDAFTGAYDKMDIRGVGGLSLGDKWKDGPVTYLGMLVHDFPNMLMIAGPQSGGSSGNFPRAIEAGVSWCTDLLKFIRDRGYSRAEATPEAEQQWLEHVTKMYSKMLNRKARSWITGYNSNVEGHAGGQIRYNVYNGGFPRYCSIVSGVAERNYEGIAFSSPNDLNLPSAVAGEPHKTSAA